VIIGPSLHKSCNFPLKITDKDDLTQKINESSRSLKWKFKEKYHHNPIGHEKLSDDQLVDNIYAALCLINQRFKLDKIYIKFTMSNSVEL